MAFQPIVDVEARSVFAYEALVRGPAGESAGSILQTIGQSELYAFDQACRVTAIETAAALSLGDSSCDLSINFLPNAVYEPRACIRTTLEAAARTSFPTQKLIFEISERELLSSPDHLAKIVMEYAAMGFRTAVDDFGSGYSNLNLLAKFVPHLVKLDMELIRGIEADKRRRSIVAHCAAMCREMGISVVAEGIETINEYSVLNDLGITLMQGYLFAKPGFRSLPIPTWPS
ncbi:MULTISPECIES: EAL domain-containing protein [unclassified Acidocella]|uniref:EAL domain-containing protein n=1 Tax=unclassified Acidocella TaxID=2648610 RepID=UPI00028C85DA|nr:MULTISPECIES: EAL domain-containing protein [unclassified Acidocella]EKM98216.1 diguanylate phosphodiesterase [Acidocella sp. MX-AZ02]WBO61042.1 EAL domain-containing protein [Acidocella sp. MX-AZ03]